MFEYLLIDKSLESEQLLLSLITDVEVLTMSD